MSRKKTFNCRLLRLLTIPFKKLTKNLMVAFLLVTFSGSLFAQPPTESIRITVDDSLLQSSTTFSSAEKQTITNTVNDVVVLLEAMLEVAPTSQSIVIDSSCLNVLPGTPVTTSAANSDFVLFLYDEATAASVSVAAGHCQTGDFGRPVVARMIFRPPFLAEEDDIREDIVLQQFIRALGFNSSLFPSFRDGIGGPLRTNVTTNFTLNGKTATGITTPNALAAARDHFNCPTMTSVEIEDSFAGSGISSQYWESRIFDNEIMTFQSQTTGNPLSTITLGLLEDTGWYIPDYSLAEPLLWGRGEGCGFIENSCDTFSSEYFCTTPGEQSCNVNRRAKASCSIGSYPSALPGFFQYFPNPNTGGTRQEADYCPRTIAISPLCSDNSPLTSTENIRGVSRGADSLCFNASLVQQPFGAPATPIPNCYNAVCNNSVLQVTVGGSTVDCPTQGGNITFNGFNGIFECPAAADVCGLCGDGQLNGEETCDDGNSSDGDGCSASCKIETNYKCSGLPSTCTPTFFLSIPLLSPVSFLALFLSVSAIAGIGFRKVKRKRLRHN